MFKTLLIAVTTLLFVSSLHAQESTELLSPFARGAGRTFSVSARGLDAMGLNPALLGLGIPRPFEISILPVGSIGTNAGPTIVHLQSIGEGFQDTSLSSIAPASTSGTIGDSTREAIVDYLKSNKLSSAVSTRLFGLSFHDADIGSIGLAWTLHVAIRAAIPDSLLEYLGKNATVNLAAQAVLGPTNVDIQGLAYSEYMLTYARNIIGRESSSDLQLRAGLGLKYIAGIELLSVDPTSSFAINTPQPDSGGSARIVANYNIHFAYPSGFSGNGLPTAFSLAYLTAGSAGSGFGADIGLTFGAFDSSGYAPWQLSLSVADMGSITWTTHTDIRSANANIQARFVENVDVLNSKISAVGGQLDTTDAPFTTNLPTTLHIGGAVDLASIGLEMSGFHISAAAEYALGLTDVVGAPNHGRFGLAAMLIKPSKGFSYHTAIGFTTQEATTDATFAFGIGIGNSFQLDLGTARLFGLFNSDGNKDGVIGMKFLF